MNKNKERLSFTIVIVTYNGMPWLESCIKSCENYPIVVVDNASTDDTVNFIERNFPKVTLLKQIVNLGFGKANNIGIRYALDHGADHVFLLNQDAYLVDDVLNKLIAFQRTNPKFGIVSPVHINKAKDKLDRRFSKYMFLEKTGQFYSDFVLGNTLENVYEVPFVNAAAWLISKQCLEAVGGFDPIFFHYGEDDNYCQRVSYHGFKLGVLPQTYIIHDRDDKVAIKPERFSVAYYSNQEKVYKLLYANVLKENKIDDKIEKLRCDILKLQLKANFKLAKSLKLELQILENIKLPISKSRLNNVEIGKHYL